MTSHYAQTFLDPRRAAFEFTLPDNDVVSEDPEEYHRTRETGDAGDGIEAVSYDSNAFEDELGTPGPKYDRQSVHSEDEEDKDGEKEDDGKKGTNARKEKTEGDARPSERKASPKSTLHIETGAQTKEERETPPAGEKHAAPQKVAVETRSIFSRSFRSRKSASVRSQATATVFSTKRHSLGGNRGRNRAGAA